MAIICGTDLSEASERALDVACTLAARRGDDEVILVHVVEDEARAEEARPAVEALAATRRGVSVRVELVAGPAEATLSSFAETEGGDLVVIAASSRGGSMLRLGSTAERLVATTRVPVLLVRDPAPWLAFGQGTRPLRILLGIDDSVASELGVQWTHTLSAQGPVEIVLGAVYYPDESAEHYGLHARTLVDRDPEIEKLVTRDLLRRYGTHEHVTARARRGLGRIGDHVIELAQEAGVDVIVVGTGQKTGLGRLGSVSTVIVHDAPQSVVCVPPNAAVPTVCVPPITSALVATDLSAFANRAVPYAFAMTPEGGEVHITHVVAEDAEIDETELRAALLALAPSGMKRQVSAHVVRGEDAAKTIAQAAARLGVDTICIASHGRSGITRALVGSVADRLLRETRKPVLVLRPG